MSSFKFNTGHDSCNRVAGYGLIFEEIIVIIFVTFNTIPVFDRHIKFVTDWL